MPEFSDSSRARLRRRAFVKQQACAALGLLALRRSPATASSTRPIDSDPLRVRIWCEGTAPRNVYPDEIDGAVSEALRGESRWKITTARLDQPDAGLPDAVLDQTDVLVWWGRLRHDELPDARSDEIVSRVKAGRLGFVALHGSYGSKPFKTLMGKTCEPKAWRDEGKPERVTIESPDHPIAQNVEPFTIPRSQMFAEPFEVPDPETVVLRSTWETGESFRSGMTWTMEKGRVAYLRPGDDSFPVLFHPAVKQIILNAVQWVGRRV